MGEIEILTYSTEQLNIEADQEEKWYGVMKTLFFYNGIQFTDRRVKNSEPPPFEDRKVIYVGIIDEAKISEDKLPMYKVYLETRNILEEREHSKN
jgi:hypothetical protein